MIFEKKLIRFTLWAFIVVVGNAVRIIFVCIWKWVLNFCFGVYHVLERWLLLFSFRQRLHCCNVVLFFWFSNLRQKTNSPHAVLTPMSTLSLCVCVCVCMCRQIKKIYINHVRYVCVWVDKSFSLILCQCIKFKRKCKSHWSNIIQK